MAFEQKSGEHLKMKEFELKKSDSPILNDEESFSVTPTKEINDTLNVPFNKNNIYVEGGWATELEKKSRNTVNLGIRHDLIHTNKMQWQVGTSIFYTPLNIQYNLQSQAIDPGQKVNTDNMEQTLKNMTGINFATYFQVNFKNQSPLYFHFNTGTSIIRVREESMTIDRSLGTTIASPDFSQANTSGISSDLKVERITMFGSMGIGYRFRRFGLEMYYRLNQGALSDSGLKNEDAKWSGSLGLTGMYKF